MRVPTVKIKTNTERGFAIINESDFDPDKHTRFDDAGPMTAPAVPSVAEPISQVVSPDDMTDDQLRDAITKLTGMAPHWKSGRDKLLERYAEATGAAK